MHRELYQYVNMRCSSVAQKDYLVSVFLLWDIVPILHFDYPLIAYMVHFDYGTLTRKEVGYEKI